ncbi:MAG: hypothetical protein KC478_16340, partial [Bacteriovoracaceae bacterium]|nr:hypothetical protein [Bacteriovoracaceae bacterium]
MKITNLILSFTISLPTMAGGYLKLGKEYVDKEVHEIKNFPTIRTQDGVGICYSASATQLLNYEYCKQNKLDCSLPENQLSLLDVTARYEYMTKSISIGGSPFTLLRNLKDHTRTLYKEQCLPFELLAHKDAERDENAQGEAYEVLEQIYNQHPRYLSDEQKTCHAKTIKSILPLEKDLAAIMDAYHSNSIAQFVYEVAVRDECADAQQKVKVPTYNPGIYPSHSNRYEIDASKLLSK